LRLLEIGALVCLSASVGAAAEEPPIKPLPGNKACRYPARAQRTYIAGPVRFAMDIRPDGTVSSVEVYEAPSGNLGFEETVQECLSKWRFERAPAGETGLRHQEGQLHFQVDAKNEAAVRALMEAMAAAWNARDMAALEDLTARAGDSSTAPIESMPSLRAQLEGQANEEPWRMLLEPEVERIQFHGENFVSVRQAYRRVPVGAGSTPARAERLSLDAFALRGRRGWRFVRISAPTPGAQDPVRVGGAIREPRKISDVRPRYPDKAKAKRIQGTVVLQCVISPTGKVADLTLLYAIDRSLADAAMEAVRQWEYTPTLVDGRPVPVTMTVTVTFRLS
jgi:TonB family protein